MEKLHRRERTRPARPSPDEDDAPPPGRRTLAMRWPCASRGPSPVAGGDAAWASNLPDVPAGAAGQLGLVPFVPGPILRSAEAPAPASIDPDVIAAALAGPGEALPEALRRQLERLARVDLSGVRVRVGDAAARAAAHVGAAAFAIGQEIVFGAGRYRPGTPDGDRLVAHEVAHTIQQRGAAARPGAVEVSAPGDAGEVEADRFADAIATRAPTPALSPAPAAGRTIQGEWEQGARLPTQPEQGSTVIGEGRRRGRRPGAPIRMYHFAGRDPSQRILLIGGMHGNERAGMEVVDIILDHLRTRQVRPRYDVYVIPVLHQANAEEGRRNSPAGDPNRDFPAEGESFGAREARRTDPATPRRARPRRLQPETEALLRAIEERIRPTRIVQVHGTTHHDRAGFSRDAAHAPRTERERAREARDARQARRRSDPPPPPATDADAVLVREMADRMRERHPESVRGNDGGRVDWPGGIEGGTSLGEWGSAPNDARGAISVITVETDGNEASVDVRRRGRETPEDTEQRRAARRAEMMDLARIIEELILDPDDRPAAGGRDGSRPTTR